MTNDPLLDRAAIRLAFRRLGERLQQRGVVADIYVIGGAAMALAYDSRRATRDIDDHPGLRVTAASPEHLLAMKMFAARRRDADDVRLLVQTLGLADPQQVRALCEQVFPAERLPDRAQMILDDIFTEQSDT